MSDETQNDEAVVYELRPELIIYISDAGKVCLRQDYGAGESEVDIVHIDPADIDNLVDYLRDYQQKAMALPSQIE